MKLVNLKRKIFIVCCNVFRNNIQHLVTYKQYCFKITLSPKPQINCDISVQCKKFTHLHICICILRLFEYVSMHIIVMNFILSLCLFCELLPRKFFVGDLSGITAQHAPGTGALAFWLSASLGAASIHKAALRTLQEPAGSGYWSVVIAARGCQTSHAPLHEKEQRQRKGLFEDKGEVGFDGIFNVGNGAINICTEF